MSTNSLKTPTHTGHVISISCTTFILFVIGILLSAISMTDGLIAFSLQPHHTQHTSYYARRYYRKTSTTQHYLATSKHSPLEDEPWQNDDSYWDALQVASKDPATFEKFIEESISRKKQGKGASNIISASTTINNNTANGLNGESQPKKRGKYVPIEEWDASRNADDMSKEERLMWECQRNGNQIRQNEILMHNLKGF